MATDFENSEYFKLISAQSETKHQGGKAATDLLLSHVPITAETRLLEIGCGSGKTLKHLADSPMKQLVGIDVSQKSLQWASNHLTAHSSHIPINQADVHHLPFADNTFDVVLVESVLIFCEATIALAEIHRILKAGSYLAVNETLALDEAIVPHLTRLQQTVRLPYLSPYMDKDWKMAFEKLGFSVQWQTIKPISRIKVLMLLQMLQIDNAIENSDAIGYGLYVLGKQ